MKRSFFLLCAVLFVLGSLLPLAGYRLAKTVLGPSAPASSAAAPEPETPDSASLPPSDRDSETFLIADQSDGAVVSVPRRDYLIGAVAAEMPITWPDEALKAQAIAAHSYVLYCRDHAQDHAAGWLTADPARRQLLHLHHPCAVLFGHRHLFGHRGGHRRTERPQARRCEPDGQPPATPGSRLWWIRS